MKTLEEIKEEYAIEYKYTTWEEFINDHPNHMIESFMDGVSKRYALEVAKQTQINCANNAKLDVQWSFKHMDVIHSVDKKSILSPSNIPNI